MKQRTEDKFKSGIYVIQNNINGKSTQEKHQIFIKELNLM